MPETRQARLPPTFTVDGETYHLRRISRELTCQEMKSIVGSIDGVNMLPFEIGSEIGASKALKREFRMRSKNGDNCLVGNKEPEDEAHKTRLCRTEGAAFMIIASPMSKAVEGSWLAGFELTGDKPALLTAAIDAKIDSIIFGTVYKSAILATCDKPVPLRVAIDANTDGAISASEDKPAALATETESAIPGTVNESEFPDAAIPAETDGTAANNFEEPTGSEAYLKSSVKMIDVDVEEKVGTLVICLGKMLENMGLDPKAKLDQKVKLDPESAKALNALRACNKIKPYVLAETIKLTEEGKALAEAGSEDEAQGKRRTATLLARVCCLSKEELAEAFEKAKRTESRSADKAFMLLRKMCNSTNSNK
jgi:hypothetical protein